MRRPGQARPDAIRGDWIIVALAVLLAVLLVAGASFHETNSAAWLVSSPGAALGSLVVIAFTAALLTIVLRLLVGWLDRVWRDNRSRVADEGILPMRAAMRRWLLPTWSALMAGWLPWLLIHFPGNVDSDTITQMFEWLNYSPRSDHHPWFDTMVFGWFWDLGQALGSYTYGLFAILLVQEMATALGIALVLVYLGRLGLPTRARWILTVVVAVFPVFVITPSVLSKDSFAGVFWTPFLIVFVESVRTRGRVLLRPWVGAGTLVLTVVMALAERPNLYLVILCVVVLILVAARGTRWRIAVGTLAVVVLTSVVWGMIVLPAWKVGPGGLTDVLSIPLQQTARTVKEHGSSLPQSDRRVINAVLGYDGLAEAYVPTRSDAVKARWSSTATRRQQVEYLSVWFDEMFRYPGTYVAATFNNSYEFFAPLTPIDFQTSLSLAHYVPFWHSLAYPTTTVAQISAVADSLRSPARLDATQRSINAEATSLMAADPLASKAFYASWLPLIALAVGLRRRSWLQVVATLPVFVTLAILVAGPIALPRYEIPSIYASVLLVGLLLVPSAWQPRRLDVSPATPPAGAGTPREVGDPAGSASDV